MTATQTLTTDRCEYCGAIIAGGYTGCQAYMNELTALSFTSKLSTFPVHRTTVDCYMLQHPEIGCVSAKSYAAHLGGLCCKMEFKDQNETYAAIQRWLNGKVELEKPKVLSFRGSLRSAHRARTDGCSRTRARSRESSRWWR